MNIQKAIKILKREKEGKLLNYPNDLKDAQQLAIEALERVKLTRKDHLSRYSEPLPSETPD